MEEEEEMLTAPGRRSPGRRPYLSSNRPRLRERTRLNPEDSTAIQDEGRRILFFNRFSESMKTQKKI